MIRKAMFGTALLFGVIFAASGSMNAQRPTPGPLCGTALGVGTGTPCKGGTTTTTTSKAQYTAQQVAQMKQQIAGFSSQLGQWINYRNQVAQYWNDPYYYQWARSEYTRANGWIQYFQGSKNNFENALRSTGQL